MTTNLHDDILEENEKPSLEEDFTNDFEKAEYLQKLLVNASTKDGPTYDDHYIILRNHFLCNSEMKKFVPSFVRTNRDLSQFWQFIKYKFSTYAERRQFIWNEFHRLMEYLEEKESSPISDSIDQCLTLFDSEHVLLYWKKALERKENDPEGAITISRTLMEGVLKHILDFKNVNYNNNSDLHEIYKIVTNELNLSPEQHDIKVFKQILGGCSAIVNGLGNLRNKHGDAHGKGKEKYYKPSKRHAELAVNLSGSMCLFLIQTLQQIEEVDKIG
jgi:Abortive infection C-terminus